MIKLLFIEGIARDLQFAGETSVEMRSQSRRLGIATIRGSDFVKEGSETTQARRGQTDEC